MNKLIRLHEETYNRLDNLRGKRETFDQVVNRLCSVFETIKAIPDTLGPSHYLMSDKPPGRVKPVHALGFNEGDDESP